VIAFEGGSVREVIEDGVTGFIVRSVDEAIAALRRIDEIDRRECRAAFERRFTANRMARQYLQLYRELMRATRSRVAS
jgi:glycosyltransferase involved in cell wall biosynthesis